VAGLNNWTAASCICELTLSPLSRHSRKAAKPSLSEKGKFNAKVSLKPSMGFGWHPRI
jgi:hypothetical protein